jgi:3-oxoadipate enol-lactonase
MSPVWVLLHGTPLTPDVWSEVASILGGEAEVIVPTVTLHEGEQIDALAERLLRHLPDGGTVHLAGHSFGGQVALELALRAQERFSTLTLFCTRDTPFPNFHAVAEGVRRGDPTDVEGTLGRWFRADELAEDGPVVTYARDCLINVDRQAWARSLDAIATFDEASSVSRLTLPVQLVAAELDRVSTVEAMRDMAGRIPGSRLTVLPKAAHMSIFLRPHLLAKTLTETSALGRSG